MALGGTGRDWMPTERIQQPASLLLNSSASPQPLLRDYFGIRISGGTPREGDSYPSIRLKIAATIIPSG